MNFIPPFNPQKNKVLKILFYKYIYNVFKRDFAEVPKFCHIRLDESEPDANSLILQEANNLSNS